MNITLIATLRCNLMCAHCLHGDPDQRPDFPLDLLPRLLIEAKPFGTKHVVLTGGEACLHPEFDAMIALIVGAGYTWSFISNGMDTAPYERAIVAHGEQLTRVSLSLDGATAGTHNAIRNHPHAFDRVINAARRYQELGYRVKLKTSLNRRNQHELEAIVHLAEELGATAVEFAGTIPAPGNHDLALSADEQLALFERLQAVTPEVGIPVHFTSALYTAGGVYFCNVLGLRALYFNAEGEMVFCCDASHAGSVIGALRRYPLAQLIQMWLQRAAELQQARVRVLGQGAVPAGFDTCAYCTQYFAPPDA